MPGHRIRSGRIPIMIIIHHLHILVKYLVFKTIFLMVGIPSHPR